MSHIPLLLSLGDPTILIARPISAILLALVAFYSVMDFIAAYKLALYWMGIIKTPHGAKAARSTRFRDATGTPRSLKCIGKL
jgi:hypothetical protein